MIYYVKPGDSLWKISNMFGVPLNELVIANAQIPNPNIIFLSQPIIIPKEAPGEKLYKISAGDSLYKIANKFGVAVIDILKVNPQLINPDQIFIGQVIIVPTSILDLSIIAYTNNENGKWQLKTILPNATNPQTLVQVNSKEVYPYWSPNGASIAYINDSTIMKYDIKSKQSSTLAIDANSSIQFLSWADYGNNQVYIAYSSKNGDSKIINASTGKVIGTIKNSSNPNLLPIEKKVIYLKNNQIYSSNFDGSSEKQLTSTPIGRTLLVISPDGKFIAYYSSNSIYILELSTSKEYSTSGSASYDIPGNYIRVYLNNTTTSSPIKWSWDSKYILFNNLLDITAYQIVYPINPDISVFYQTEEINFIFNRLTIVDNHAANKIDITDTSTSNPQYCWGRDFIKGTLSIAYENQDNIFILDDIFGSKRNRKLTQNGGYNPAWI